MEIRKIAKNAAWLGAIQILSYAVPLLTLPVVTRAFGPGLYGVIATLTAYAGYVALLVDYGFGFTGPRLVARTQSDLNRLSAQVTSIIVAQLFLTCPAVIAFLLAIKLMPAFGDYAEASILILVQVIFGALTPQWVFVGLERVKAFALIQVAVRSFAAVAIVFFIRAPEHLNIFLAINAAASILIFSSSVFVLATYGVTWKYSAQFNARSALRESAQMFFSTLAINMYTGSNVVVISQMLGPHSAGIFSLADKLRLAAGGITGPVSSAIYPFICRIAGRTQTHEEIETKRVLFFAVAVLSAVVSLLLFACAPFVVAVLAGPNFRDASLILQILSPLPFVIVLSNIFGIQNMLPLGLDRQLNWIVSSAAILGFVGMIATSALVGLVGATISFVLTECFVTVATMLVLQRHLNVRSLFFR